MSLKEEPRERREAARVICDNRQPVGVERLSIWSQTKRIGRGEGC